MSMPIEVSSEGDQGLPTEEASAKARLSHPMLLVAVLVSCALLGTLGTSPVRSQASVEPRLEILDQIGGASYALDVAGDVVFAGVGPRVVALDVSGGSAAPEYLGQSAPLPGVVIDLIHHRDHVFVLTSGLNQTHIIALNVVDPRYPLEVGRSLTSGLAVDFSIADDLAIISEAPDPEVRFGASATIEIILIEDPSTMESASWFTVEDGIRRDLDVEAHGDRIYSLDSGGVVRIFDVSDPADPKRSGVVRVPGAESIAVLSARSRLFAASDDALMAFDLVDPDDPEEVARVEEGFGDRIYATESVVLRYTGGTPTRVEAYRSADLAPLGSYWVQSDIEDLASVSGKSFAVDAASGVLVLPPFGDEIVEPVTTWRSAGTALRVDVESDRMWVRGASGIDVITWAEGARVLGHWPAPSSGVLLDIMPLGDDRVITSHSLQGLVLIDCAEKASGPTVRLCTTEDSLTFAHSGFGMEFYGRYRDHLYAATPIGNLYPIAFEDSDHLRIESPINFSEQLNFGRFANARFVHLDESHVLLPAFDGLVRLDLGDPAAPVIQERIALDADEPPAHAVIRSGDTLYALPDESPVGAFPNLSPVEDRRLFMIEGMLGDERRVERRAETLPDNIRLGVRGGTILRALPSALVYEAPWLLTSGRAGLLALDPTVPDPVEGATEFRMAAIVEDLFPLDAAGEYVAAVGDAGVYRLGISDSASATREPTSAPSPLPTREPTIVPTTAPPRPSTLFLPVAMRPASPPKASELELNAVLDGNVRDIVRVDDMLYIVRGRHVELWRPGREGDDGAGGLSFITRSPLLPAVPQGLDAEGDTVVVTLGYDGLWTLRRHEDDRLEIAGRMTTADEARDVVHRGDHAFVAVSDAGVEVVSLVDPATPEVIARLETRWPAWRLSVDGGTLAILTEEPHWLSGGPDPAIFIADVSDPHAPVMHGRFDADPSATFREDTHLRDIVVVEETVYAVAREGRLMAIDIGDPTAPALLSETTLCGPSWETLTGRIAVHGDLLLVGGWGQCWLNIIDISDRRRLEHVSTVERFDETMEGAGIVTGIVMSDTAAWLAYDHWAFEVDHPDDYYYIDGLPALGSGGVAEISLSDPAEPSITSEHYGPGLVVAAEPIPDGAVLLVEPYESHGSRSASLWRLPIVDGVPGAPIRTVTLPGEEDSVYGALPLATDWPYAFAITASGTLHAADLETGEALGTFESKRFSVYGSEMDVGSAADGGDHVLFVRTGSGSGKGLMAIDVSDPRLMRIVDEITIEGRSDRMVVSENVVFTIGGSELIVHHLTATGVLERVGSLPVARYVEGVAAIPPYLYMIGDEKLIVYEMLDGELPRPIGDVAVEGWSSIIKGVGDRVWIGGDRLLAFDVSVPGTPRLAGSWQPPPGSDGFEAYLDSIVGSSTSALGIARSDEATMGLQRFFRLQGER